MTNADIYIIMGSIRNNNTNNERENEMFQDFEFTYKGHVCKVEFMHEPDVIKAWHTVVKPDGEEVFADITPYDSTDGTLMLWVDAGYPKRIGCGPLHREDLEKIIESALDNQAVS